MKITKRKPKKPIPCSECGKWENIIYGLIFGSIEPTVTVLLCEECFQNLLNDLYNTEVDICSSCKNCEICDCETRGDCIGCTCVGCRSSKYCNNCNTYH